MTIAGDDPDTEEGATAHADLAAQILDALADRLRAAARHILPTPPDGADDPDSARSAATLLPALVGAVAPSPAVAERWVLFAAVHARYPGVAEFAKFSRSLQSENLDDSMEGLLLSSLQARGPFITSGMRIVTDGPVVEVYSAATTDYMSGIQRVVRETVPRWTARNLMTLARWSDDHFALQSLTSKESARAAGSERADAAPVDPEFVVPYRTDVVFLDAPRGSQADGWAAMARFSGNRVHHVGYDLIPLTSADLREHGESADSTALISVVKHSHSVACISEATAAEFAGYAQTFPAQGLVGPVVSTVPLPEVTRPRVAGSAIRGRRGDAPVVIVCPGTREKHKNHEAILWAAERLWRDGLEFELRFMGRMGRDHASFAEVERQLMTRGRRIVELGSVTDHVLWHELSHADAVVFASIQEGFGLPVVEALSVGTPVMTTAYGSQGEIARGGGCLTVDPRDDRSMTEGLRRLVSEPELRAQLRAEIRERPQRTWDDYADDLWRFFFGGGVSSR
jgi:glycosyltransferase involved in cell wall biosynthesis